MAKRSKTASPPVIRPPLPIRVARLHFKLFAGIVVGAAASLAMTAFDVSPLARVLTGWDIGVVVYLLLALRFMKRHDVPSIRRIAAEEDEGGRTIFLLSMIATIASLVAIVFALTEAKQKGQPLAIVLTIATIMLSWAFVHTIFTFHYAHEYYGERRDGALGGLDFPGDKTPDYYDFLYFSLVIGMTSQVSDVQITSKVIRRMASQHGVLSFFFNLVVLALTINTIASLI